ncbi:MAG: TatD family hydrolase [Clostridia bacterium]|nr:TatD family hydrolase [Clostridia bacterium]
MLFDTHAHYDDEKFEKDRNEVILKAHASGVDYILNAACNISSAVECIALSQEYDFIYAAVGIHPHNVEDLNDNTITTLADFAKRSKVVAIGEIGLDYYYDHAPREVQKYWFARQIELARSIDLPIIVHNRDAHEDSMNIIKTENAKSVGGVFHCYSGSVEMARELLNQNFYISVGGAVTFKNAVKILEVVKFVPMDRLLIETDCPYLTPEPHRGKRNDSSYVRLVAEKIAEIKGKSFEEIAEITAQNGKTLFEIK